MSSTSIKEQEAEEIGFWNYFKISAKYLNSVKPDSKDL